MTQQAEIINKIERLPQRYFSEVLDFVGYLEHKAKQEAYDNEGEQKIGEMDISPSQPKVKIPVNSEGKFILSKKVLEELERNSPITQSLCGIIPGMSDLTDDDLDEIRYKALAEKHLK